MKKFEILSSENQEEKLKSKKSKFEIKKISNSIHATIGRIEFDGRDINWSKQIDGNSCGYCLINNASNFLEIDTGGNIESIFTSINRRRRENNQKPLPRNRNLPASDIRDYFRQNGYNVEVYTGKHDMSEIESRVRERDFTLLYTTSGIHYVGVVLGENGEYYLLDSMQDEPIMIDANAVIVRAQNSLGRDETNNRWNQVGLVYKPKKKFKIHKKLQINR